VKIRKLIERPIRYARDGLDIVGDVNAVVDANVEERGGSTTVSSRQRVVRRSGETEVADDGEASAEPGRDGSTKGAGVTDEQALSSEELEAAAGDELPDRDVMSLINANLAAPVNAAVAANVRSDDAVAHANAEQDAEIDQST
jgi:hypothetical protein